MIPGFFNRMRANAAAEKRARSARSGGGPREIARRRSQIERGQLTESNGLGRPLSQQARRLQKLVTAGMRARGIPGRADIGDNGGVFLVSFTRAGGDRCGVTVGGQRTGRRSVYNLAAVAVNRMAEWYEREASA